MVEARMRKISSIDQLHHLSKKDPRYRKLIILAATRLHGERTRSIDKALFWLKEVVAAEGDMFGSGESDTVAEINGMIEE